MQQTFKLSWDAVESLASRYATPLLVLSLEQVEYNYNFLQQHLPGVKVYYAVKSNPEPSLVKKLAQLGSSFDVASDGEILALRELGIPPERMVYANPVKTARGLAVAQQTGVRQFTFDSATEIDKIAAYLPGATVLLRVRIDNDASLVNLNKKFGADAREALDLLLLARQKGLDVAGLCFHVGSQNNSAAAYLDALLAAHEIFQAAALAGLKLRILDIGGGFPIPTGKTNIDTMAMLKKIHQQLVALFPNTEIWSEPGRFISGTAMNLITSVIGAQIRNGRQWYYLDEGLYGTFSGILFDHWEYEMETARGKQGPEIEATFAGPSCDSLDIVFPNRRTVRLELGDLILVPNCGAYSSASATTFNGFAKAAVVVWEEVKEKLQPSMAAVS
ncbi:Lysine/ornithine decarboxylase [Desulforamulus hydrothermalis Lam5 = DSM 18033]|uniref:ornithine decarboxylase n=1 Tax=Desulforamulus hydrothermalis Lam5 = DSM 18033 TaxID=1121428 RepID=K8DXA1_9FIRM|nr:type III PLP-dependent enzyme [Desulforamulus hydrothermalis]CCO07100.1 Lysine/ornithine decarboxylase [Desulforamulus hydrothermalis Lam5 = DSM 18033]SHG90149.1 ornithine decarboxylase [Desulforamulus hydrothermalis Lam5 = DSM 18033]